jgi:acylphosphatase
MATCSGWPAEGFSSRNLPGCGTLRSVKNVKRARIHALYSGTVQGVGFRYTVKALTTGFEVTGTVANLPDGRVELLAEGAQSELEAFAEAIRASELGHFIRDEKIRWDQARNEFRGFEIVR